MANDTIWIVFSVFESYLFGKCFS